MKRPSDKAPLDSAPVPESLAGRDGRGKSFARAAKGANPNRSRRVDDFVTAARAFAEWARTSEVEGPAAAREALGLIAALYSAGLRLPSYGDAASEDSVVPIAQEELRQVVERAARLPFQYYSELFDPLPIPAEVPVLGDLADDIGDIYRDIVAGLRLFDQGDLEGALWQWLFNLVIHWGRHATAAMRALQCYLADADLDLSLWTGG